MKQKKGLTTKALESALLHHQGGRLKQAEAIYRKILRWNPRQPEALYHSGIIAIQTGRYQNAVDLLQQAINVHPDNPDYFYYLGMAAMESNNDGMALQAFERALALRPDYAAAYNDLGTLQEKNGKIDAAIDCYRKAIKYKPDCCDAYFNLARTYGIIGDAEAAISNYEKVLELDPRDSDAYNNLGNYLKEKGETAKAVELYRKSIQFNPDSSRAYCNMGRAMRDMGDKEGALAAFRKALSLKPGDYEALYELALSEHHSEYNDDLQAMEELLQKPATTSDQKMHLSFGLGKAFEELKEYDRAFNYFKNGNTLKRNTFKYSIERDKEYFNKIKDIFNTKFFSTHKEYGHKNNSQIFIVGMPRSGTTLVEQIIASHPQVQGAGEFSDFKHELFGDTDITSKQFTDFIIRLEQHDIEQLGDKYIKIIAPHQKGRDYITNKSTQNFIYIGLIRLIFPQAKIIHCQRDPIATCLSCYKHLFSQGSWYAYDLHELASFYLLYRDLMQHWHATLPAFIFDNQYEDLIADQENQTKKLLDFCGLSWDERCLNFHRTKRSVKTASFQQVRRPIYTSAVAFWKNYEKHLGILMQAFEKG